MKTVPLNQIFDVSYGNKFDLKNMTLNTKSGIAFVGRTAKNNGVVAFVEEIKKKPYPAGLITVNLGGAILSSFVQLSPFYTAQNIAVLTPLKPMSEIEKLYYCHAIYANKFRYGAFGREANRTLRTLQVPAHVPASFVKVNPLPPASSALLSGNKDPYKHAKQWFQLEELFDIKKGKRLTKEKMRDGNTPFVGSTAFENGITAYIDQKPIHKGGTISVTYNGSVAEAFYQPNDFWASDDVNVLYPKFEMNAYIALFLTTVIRKEKYRYNYGRKWHLDRMRASKILLPIDENKKPNWKLMENYIKSLPYSVNI